MRRMTGTICVGHPCGIGVAHGVMRVGLVFILVGVVSKGARN